MRNARLRDLENYYGQQMLTLKEYLDSVIK